ncbi:hypothetical protein ACFQ88_21565 [Paenibacillus sp. NPDC056579]|nr:hypothetical protein [Paenibacillus sp. H1-7]
MPLVICLLLPALFISVVLAGCYLWGMRDYYSFMKLKPWKRKEI